jgi:hypothetical protein
MQLVAVELEMDTGEHHGAGALTSRCPAGDTQRVDEHIAFTAKLHADPLVVLMKKM